jgi:aldehyde dehydrogenase (NAD+)
LLIDGTVLERSSAGTDEHVNPATGKPQREVVMAGVAEVDQAVAAARAALPAWAAWHPARRRDALLRFAHLVRDQANDLVSAIALETGTPVALGGGLIELCASWTETAAVCCEQLHGQVIDEGPGVFDYTLAEPIGVAAVILTWNAPVGSFGMCVAPALAAGCTVVIKPSELAPFTTIALAKLCEDAGIPPGVVNVVPGGPDAGAALVEHRDVAKISFTGGTTTARKIAAAAATTLKPLVLELGGKSANIVFDDADLPTAVGHATSIIGLAGQGCTLPSRLLVQERVYEQVVTGVGQALGTIPVGDPLDPTVFMGPVISAAACNRIVAMMDNAKTTSRLVVGGERLGGSLADGYFVAPTAFADVEPDSELAQAEVFGPVLAITSFSDEAEAIAVANGTEFGLAGYLHTRDLGRAHRMAAALDAGNIGINGGGAPAGPSAPFGGVKQSGYGREGGVEGVREFIRTKNVEIKLG